MARATYEVWVYDRNGIRSAVIDPVINLSYALTVNAPGAMTLLVPDDELDDELLLEDTQFEVWRTPDGGAPIREGETLWLLQSSTRGIASDGRYRRIVATAAMDVLSRRHVKALAGSAGALLTGHTADNMMKVYAEAAFGATAGTFDFGAASASRSWNGTVNIAPLQSFGPSTTKDASYRNLLQVCQEIASTAATEGEPVYFDVVWNSNTATEGNLLEFRTYIEVRGVDRTDSLLVSYERGTLGGTVEVTTQYKGTASAVYALGGGVGAARLVGHAGDVARIYASPLGLRETVINVSGTEGQTALDQEAGAELYRRRARAVLTGELQDIDGARYGLDWGFGDKIRAEFDALSFEARVNAVTVTLRGGVESVRAEITGEQVI